MDANQALQLLDSAVAEAPLNRLDHIRVQQAVDVLKKALEKPKEEKKTS